MQQHNRSNLVLVFHEMFFLHSLWSLCAFFIFLDQNRSRHITFFSCHLWTKEIYIAGKMVAN